MKNQLQIPLIFLILLICMLPACANAPQNGHTPSPTIELPTSQPSPSPTPRPNPTATSTPKPDFLFSSLTIIEGSDSGGISVIGFIKNNTPYGVTEISIDGKLYTQAEGEVTQKEILLPQKHLNSFEEAPFLIHFADQTHAERTVIDVKSYQISGYEDADLEIEVTESFSTADRKHILVGWITNSGRNPIQIHQFQILTFNKNQTPLTLISATNHPASILPGQRIPFLTSFDDTLAMDSIQIFVDALEVPEISTPSFSFPQKVEAVLDSHGNLLVRGVIRNEDNQSRWLAAWIALRYQDQIISMAPLHPPSPLAPGESRAFGIATFPGWKERFNQLEGELEDLSIETYYDPLRCAEFKGQIIALDLEITNFETTGSTVIIKGIIRNSSSDPLSLPAVQAEMRTISGMVQTSNWTLVDERMEVGQSSTFVLSLRLPDGIQITDLEIDVRGTGILEETDLPY